jgi:outer membrane receptor protein involved in Fe transport
MVRPASLPSGVALVVLLTVHVFLAPHSIAQTAEPANSTRLPALVVTAQQRVQAIGDTPLAITAYTGTTLEQLGVSSFTDLAPLVPGLFVSVQSPGAPSINLRGIGSDSTDPRHESRISVFQDGVAISRAAGSVVEFFDLERVEVLKGPQGTLFGRNASAGALALVTRRPEASRSGQLALGFGEGNRRAASGFVNAANADARLRARVAFTTERRDGATPNLAGGSPLGGRESSAARASLRWAPSSDTTVDLILQVQRDTPSGTAFKSGVIPTRAGDTSPFTAAELNRGAELGVDRTVRSATLLVTRALDARWTLHTTSAWRAYASREEFDADGSRLYLLESTDDGHGRQFSQEVRLNFEGNAWSGFLGASAVTERARQRIDLRTDERLLWPFLSGQYRQGLLAAGVPAPVVATAVPTLAPFTPQPTLPAGFAAFAFVPPLAPLAALAGAPLKALHGDRYFNQSDFDAADLFADATWRATDQLEFTAGLRLSHEKQLAGYDAPASNPPSTLGFILNAGPNFSFAPTNGLQTLGDRTTGWTGRVLAKYALTPQLNLFGGVARGRRPATIVLTSTDRVRNAEETILNAEIGLKGRTPDGRLDWSASVLQYRYRHFQTFVQDPANVARFIPVDAGRATGTGGELNLRAALTTAWSAFATYGYTDATFDERGDNGRPQQFAGSTFRLTSRHTAALGLAWEHGLGAHGRLTVAPRLEYRSAHFFDDNNLLLGGTLRQGGFALVHLHAAWSSADRRWELAARARNLTDRAYLIDAGNTGASFGIPTYIRGEPRRFDFDVTRRW